VFSFERLQVWEKSVGFTERVLELADSLDKRDKYSLGEQLRRAVISISNNIAEGGGRRSKKEKVYFYNIAKGSVYEVVNLLEICRRRKYFKKEEHRNYYSEAEEIARMLSGLIDS
jgi:four helix bundle protein